MLRMSKASAIVVNLDKCHRLEDFEVWVDGVGGKVFFYHAPSGVAYSRVPKGMRGMPQGFLPSSKSPKASRRATSSGSTATAYEGAHMRAEKASKKDSPTLDSRLAKKARKNTATAVMERSAVAKSGVGTEGTSSTAPEAMDGGSAGAASSLLSLTEVRRESAAAITAMLKQLETDKFRIWKKREEAVELLEGRCSPCVKLLASYIPEELPGEWEVHHALRELKEMLEGTSFNNVIKSSGKGLFKKAKTDGGVALSVVKTAVRHLEGSLQGIHEKDAERMCISLQLLEQIFLNSSSGCAMWKELSSGARPDTAREDEFCFSVPFLIVWRVLMQKVPSQWQPYGDSWKRALLPLLGCEEAEPSAPSAVNAKERVTALAFSDFAILFAPLDTWWEQVRRLLQGTPEFFWFEHGPTAGDPNVFVKKPRVGNYLFRFSGTKRRRIVLQFVSEMAMRSAELQGGPRLNVRWESAAVEVLAPADTDGPCQYEFLGERYDSLSAIAHAYREHFKGPVDKSRFCTWFWSDPASNETVATSLGRGGEGSFAIARTKSERASYVLFHNGPEGLRDYLLDLTGGAISVDFNGHHVVAPTMVELLYAACAFGRFSNPVPAPYTAMRARLTNQPTMYFAGKLTATR